jgi:hypothetical protein
VGKRLYKTYLKEQVKYWKNNLAKAENEKKKYHAEMMFNNFKNLMKEHSGK